LRDVNFKGWTVRGLYAGLLVSCQPPSGDRPCLQRLVSKTTPPRIPCSPGSRCGFYHQWDAFLQGETMDLSSAERWGRGGGNTHLTGAARSRDLRGLGVYRCGSGVPIRQKRLPDHISKLRQEFISSILPMVEEAISYSIINAFLQNA